MQTMEYITGRIKTNKNAETAFIGNEMIWTCNPNIPVTTTDNKCVIKFILLE